MALPIRTPRSPGGDRLDRETQAKHENDEVTERPEPGGGPKQPGAVLNSACRSGRTEGRALRFSRSCLLGTALECAGWRSSPRFYASGDHVAGTGFRPAGLLPAGQARIVG